MKIFMIIAGCFYASSLLASHPLSFNTQIISQSNAQPKYAININYPQIHSPATESEEKFNREIEKWAQDKAAEFKKLIREWNADKLPAQIKANNSSLTINYELVTLDPNVIVSLRFNADSYFAGAAHPSHIYHSINYDLVNNKILSLSDLFKAKSNYLEQIAEISTHKVKAALNATVNGQVDVFKEGVLPTQKNYAVWNLTAKGLRFTFNEYQVAAYVFGPQEVTIPFDRLNAFFADNTPLSHCIKSKNCKITLQKV